MNKNQRIYLKITVNDSEFDSHSCSECSENCHTTTRKDVWIRFLNVSPLLPANCPLSASKCLDCGQQAVKQNKTVTSNNKHCFLEIYFQV